MVYEFTIKGLVQGVGYRPHVIRMAGKLGLAGDVRNTGGVVKIRTFFDEVSAERIFKSLREFSFPVPEGNEGAAEGFKRLLLNDYPPGARIDSVSFSLCKDYDVSRFDGTFKMADSDDNDLIPVLPADIGLCKDCARELSDKGGSRFYAYPFISCAKCGPRFSIMRSIPYDRMTTSMDEFEMCPKCRADYENEAPDNRRFLAQTISCPDCGPRLFLDYVIQTGPEGETEGPVKYTEVSKTKDSGLKKKAGTFAWGEEAFRKTVDFLKAGGVAAVKNVGGYHLVCDAANPDAVEKIRRLKRREAKPFAVMVKDVNAAEKLAVLSEKEKELLEGDARPIVLAGKKMPRNAEMTAESDGRENELPESVALKTEQDERKSSPYSVCESVCLSSPDIGIMLPSNGLQYMLSAEIPVLVMTSANFSGEPIISDDEEIKKYIKSALEDGIKLKKQANVWAEKSGDEQAEKSGDVQAGEKDAETVVAVLGNNRKILCAQDDSVVRVICGRTQVLRRSRGYVPLPVEVSGRAFATEAGRHGAENRENEPDNRNIGDEKKNDPDVLCEKQPDEAEGWPGREKITADSNSEKPHTKQEKEVVFACGADLKSVFAFSVNDKNDIKRVYFGKYLGDLANASVAESYVSESRKMLDMHGVSALLGGKTGNASLKLVSDLHPAYISSEFGDKPDLLFGKPAGPDTKTMKVQHHMAHAASVIAEQDIVGPAICFSFDGTGFGTDSDIWGGEVFVYDGKDFVRQSHLREIGFAGGDSAVRNAEFSKYCYINALFSVYDDIAGYYWPDWLLDPTTEGKRLRILQRVLMSGSYSYRSSSCGRLFDAVSAILEICRYNGYEGRCACELEYAARSWALRNKKIIRKPFGGRWFESEYGKLSEKIKGKDFDSLDIFACICLGRRYCMETGELAYVFHELLSDWIRNEAVKACGPAVTEIRSKKTGASDEAGVSTGITEGTVPDPDCKKTLKKPPVVLSGGCFTNCLLTELSIKKLEAEGFLVYTNEKVPPGDDGIALGQIYMAAKKDRFRPQ